MRDQGPADRTEQAIKAKLFKGFQNFLGFVPNWQPVKVTFKGSLKNSINLYWHCRKLIYKLGTRCYLLYLTTFIENSLCSASPPLM